MLSDFVLNMLGISSCASVVELSPLAELNKPGRCSGSLPRSKTPSPKAGMSIGVQLKQPTGSLSSVL